MLADKADEGDGDWQLKIFGMQDQQESRVRGRLNTKRWGIFLEQAAFCNKVSYIKLDDTFRDPALPVRGIYHWR